MESNAIELENRVKEANTWRKSVEEQLAEARSQNRSLSANLVSIFVTLKTKQKTKKNYSILSNHFYSNIE